MSLKAVLIPFCSLLASCLTMNHQRALADYASARREFNTESEGANFRITEGKVVQEGEKWTAYFSGVLLGKNRVLIVTGKSRALNLSEETGKLPEGSRAYLLQQNTCCMDEAAMRRVLFAKPGENLSGIDLLHSSFQTTAAPMDALAVLDFSNVFTFNMSMLCWRGSDRLACNAGPALGPYEEEMKNIRWDVRSRVVYGLMHAWYVVAVPVDIVTFPFQIGTLYLVGPGAK